ncbi:MAG TPA: ABC transporter permease [Polyangiaceae bacterium]|jgi:NitT/TauT family transport system permease protein|nr:ABC transporter permease [Polyangiaceae bacterium]
MASTGWLTIREPLPAKARTWVTMASFVLPLVVWCLLSYVPFLWHPMTLVTDPGDVSVAGDYSFIEKDQLVDRDVFAKRNLELSAAGAHLAEGQRANPIYLPAPHEVARAFYTAFTTEPQRRGDYWLHESLWHSCQIIFWGFVYAALFGVPIGLLCGTFSLFSRLFEPFIDFVRYMPAPVFGALAVAIFGLEDAPKVAIIFIGTFFQMVLVVANTTRAIDPALLHAAQTLGASNRQLLQHVVVPAIIPNLYRDMRILIGWAWTYLVVAELIGEKSGISAFIYQQQRYRHFDNVYAAIAVIGFVGLAFDQLLAQLGTLLFPWESGNHAVSRLLRRKSSSSVVGQAPASTAAPAFDDESSGPISEEPVPTMVSRVRPSQEVA